MQHSSQELLAELWKKSLLIEAFSRHQNYEYREYIAVANKATHAHSEISQHLLHSGLQLLRS